jgi:uncharacterized protein
MEKTANPGALGLGAFALTTFLLSLVNAKIIPAESLGVVLPMAFFYGGLAQVLAGMWEFKTGNIFGATCFTSFGMFWLGVGLLKVFDKIGLYTGVPPIAMCMFHFAWGFFTLYATIAAAKGAKVVFILFLALTVTFFLLAIGDLAGIFKVAGGYLGLLVAAIAWYGSAATLINEVNGKKVLPT